MQQHRTTQELGSWHTKIAPSQCHPCYLHWRRSAQHIPRSIRNILLAIIAFFAFCGLFRGIGDLRDQYTKIGPTDFTTLHRNSLLQPPARPVRFATETHIDERYIYQRHLGSGHEGSAALYLDVEHGRVVVVKTFYSTSRNPIPPSLEDSFSNYTYYWPAELEATLSIPFTAEGYVHATDYFILNSAEGWSWALVTPFISGGTLLDLAKSEKHSTTDEMDDTYRPALANMLQNLELLHKSDMCHDDVKPNNIFVQSPEQWLLGDLGMVKQKSHPWHFTRSWARQNQWQDCQLNDIRRAIKTYLWFLRCASEDTDAFDREFWMKKTSWSRLYWDFIAHPSKELDVLDKQDEIMPGVTLVSMTVEERRVQTERELICTTIVKRLWSWWEYIPDL